MTRRRPSHLCRFSRFLLFVFLFLFIAVPVFAGNGDTIVHITSSGKCYHRAGCRYLSSSDYEITLEEAHTKYSPCSVCDPPLYQVTETNIREEMSQKTSSSADTETSTVETSASSSEGSIPNSYDASILQSEASEFLSMSERAETRSVIYDTQPMSPPASESEESPVIVIDARFGIPILLLLVVLLAYDIWLTRNIKNNSKRK